MPKNSNKNQSLGGLNLGALANAGISDTQTRIAGQQDMVSQYIDSILGEQKAGFQSDSERDQRMAEFRRAQMLMEEQLNSQRLGQQASLSRARAGSAASEAAAQREHEAEMVAMERAFELGQIANSRGDEDLDTRLKELQIAAAEQQLGLGAGPEPGGWGNIVSADRGDALSDRKASSIRDMVINEGQDAGGGFPVYTPFGKKRIGGHDATEDQTVNDILRANRGDILGSFAEDPSTIAAQQRIQELLGTDDPVVLSYALRDLGLYSPQG